MGVEPTRDYSSRRFSKPVHYRSAHSPNTFNLSSYSSLCPAKQDLDSVILTCVRKQNLRHYRSAHSPGVTNYTRKVRLVSTLDDQGFPIVKGNFRFVADKFIADTASFTTMDCQMINFILKFR